MGITVTTSSGPQTSDDACLCCGAALCCRRGNCCYSASSFARVVFTLKYATCANNPGPPLYSHNPDCDYNGITSITVDCPLVFNANEPGTCHWEAHTTIDTTDNDGNPLEFEQVVAITPIVNVDGSVSWDFQISGLSITCANPSGSPLAGSGDNGCDGFVFSDFLDCCDCWQDPDPRPKSTYTISVSILDNECNYDEELDDCVIGI